MLSTGEITIESALRTVGKTATAGMDVRMINVPADAGSGMGEFEDIHGHPSPATFADHIKHLTTGNHGVTGDLWLDALTLLIAEKGVESIRQLTLLEMETFADKHTPAGADGQVCRVIRKFALAAAAGEQAATMGLLPFEAGEVAEGIGRCLKDWLAMRGTTGRGTTGPKEDQVMTAAVRQFLAQYGASRFTALDNTLDQPPSRAGWTERVEDEIVYHIQADQFAKSVSPMPSKAAIELLHKLGHATKPTVSRPHVARAGVASSPSEPMFVGQRIVQTIQKERQEAQQREKDAISARPRVYSIRDSILDVE